MCGLGRVLAEPRLSPDAGLVAFVATAGGAAALIVVPVGGGPEIVVTTAPAPPPSASYGGGTFDWTPGADALVYVGHDRCLYWQPVAGGPPRLVVGDGPVSAPAVSPDGLQVAYVRDGRHVAVASLAEVGSWPVRLADSPVRTGPRLRLRPRLVTRWPMGRLARVGRTRHALGRQPDHGGAVRRARWRRCRAHRRGGRGRPAPVLPRRSRLGLPLRRRRLAQPLAGRARRVRAGPNGARRSGAWRSPLGPGPAQFRLVSRRPPGRLLPQRRRLRPPLRRLRR